MVRWFFRDEAEEMRRKARGEIKESKPFKERLKTFVKIAALSIDIAVLSGVGIFVLLKSNTIRTGLEHPIADPTENSFLGLHDGMQTVFWVAAILGTYAVIRLIAQSALLTEWLASNAREHENIRSLFYILTPLPIIGIGLMMFYAEILELWMFVVLVGAAILSVVFSAWGTKLEEEEGGLSFRQYQTPAHVSVTAESKSLKVAKANDLSVVLSRYRRPQAKKAPRKGKAGKDTPRFDGM